MDGSGARGTLRGQLGPELEQVVDDPVLVLGRVLVDVGDDVRQAVRDLDAEARRHVADALDELRATGLDPGALLAGRLGARLPSGAETLAHAHRARGPAALPE